MPQSLPPTIHVVAGPNGAGKTTFARNFLPAMGCMRFLNADLIAAGLSPLAPSAGAVRAARVLLSEWDDLVEAKVSFGFESTLSGRGYALRLQRARAQGYAVSIYYLWIPGVSLALRRIRQRVAKGGHNVPQADVKRRFRPSLDNFFSLYLPLAHEALIFDGSLRPPELVAELRNGEQTILIPQTYEAIQQAIRAR